MDVSFVLLCVMLAADVTPASAAEKPGIIETLILATFQRPWLWSVYVFAVGLPVILFISFMWPDKRFGPPDQPYYYKKSDDPQPDDPEVSLPRKSTDEGSTLQEETLRTHKSLLRRKTKD
ncbi:calnexin-like [Archocentrus centrarchus]|uniref:calnexin-like n=1 Tax=Archocentrus centrarchus TaxID=63155 RepID=UPI0011E9DD56|nr:calnexin-like [Archocentrus centrarchus]